MFIVVSAGLWESNTALSTVWRENLCPLTDRIRTDSRSLNLTSGGGLPETGSGLGHARSGYPNDTTRPQCFQLSVLTLKSPCSGCESFKSED
jgi:hypothetical protein